MRNKTLQFLLLCAVIGLYAANGFAQPATVTPEAAMLYKHGTNSGGVNAQENTDSVTIGGTTKYYVLPDPVANPSFVYGTSLWNNVVSTFGWTVPAGLSTAGAVATAAQPTAQQYKQIVWTGTGTGNIQVIETSSTGCVGSTLLTPVAVIAAPAVTAITIPNITCHVGTVPYTLPGPAATLTISCAVLGSQGVSINYSLAGPSGFTTVTNTVSLGNSTTLDLSGINLTEPGTYTLTINNITDRIATKSGLLAIASGTAQIFVVTPQPATGPMYHVPNQ